MQHVQNTPTSYKQLKKKKGAVKAPEPETANSASVKNLKSNPLWNLWFLLIVACFILIGVLLFNAKLFLMGDDADYILDAYHFVHQGLYPAGRSSLYSMVLGIPVVLFGTNVVLLKCFSFLCAIVGFLLLYRAFYKKIPNWLLYAVLIFAAVNSSLQYFSSSNLSEAFFMMVQYGFMGTVFLLLNKLQEGERNLKKYWLLTGFMGLLISLSKNIALVAPLSLSIYFLIKKEWKNALLSLGSFLLFKLPYEVLLRVFFSKNTVVSQWSQVMAKDLYHHEKGTETLGGFIQRFLENIQIYLSKITLNEFGLNTGKERMVIAALLFVALLLYGLILGFKKNKYIFFTGIYLAVMCGGTFFALQPAVAQSRIIIIYIPLLLLLALYTTDLILKYFDKYFSILHTGGLGILLLLILLINLNRTFSKIKESQTELIENLGGSPFYGYTPDWLNYLEMGKWIKKNIPDSIVVAARKPNSLSVYSNGRPYAGIYSFPTNLNATQLLEKLKKDNIQYLVIASLRINAKQYIPNHYITTMRAYVSKVNQTYPGSFRLVHKIGGEEACYLVKINYPPKMEQK